MFYLRERGGHFTHVNKLSFPYPSESPDGILRSWTRK